MNRKYIRNTAILFASMTITKIVGAIFKIPLANVLGGTGMGYFSTAYGLYSPVFALTAAGIPTVMMRITAQNIAAGRPGNAVRTRRTALLLFSAVGFLGFTRRGAVRRFLLGAHRLLPGEHSGGHCHARGHAALYPPPCTRLP